MARRINTTLKVTDKFGADKHGWTDGGSPPTDSTSGEDGFFDHIQEETASVVESLGYTIPEEEVIANRDMMLSAMRMQSMGSVLNAWVSTAGLAYTLLQIRGGLRATLTDAFGPTGIAVVFGSDPIVYQWTSTDGIDTFTAPGAPGDIWDAVWSQGDAQFVLVGNGGRIWTMGIGATPVSRTSGTANTLRAVAYDGTIYVAGGSSGTIVTSTDGITWASRTSNLSGTILAVAHNGTEFVASDDTGGGDISTSSDGITWTSQTVTGIAATIWPKQIVWNAARSRWYAIVENTSGTPTGAVIMSSTDGIAWSIEQAVGGGNNQLRNISVGPGGIMVVTNSVDGGETLVSDGRHPWIKVATNTDMSRHTFVDGAFLFASGTTFYAGGTLL